MLCLKALLIASIVQVCFCFHLSTERAYRLGLLELSGENGQDVIPFGELIYDKESGWSLKNQLIDDILQKESDTKYCLGIEIGPETSDFNCLNYKQVTRNERLTIITGANDTIESISLITSNHEKENYENSNGGIQLITQRAKLGATPQLVTQKKINRPIDKETTTGSTSNNDEEKTQEEPEKSFIQKYWMYIIPPLMILLVFSTDQPAQGSSR
ncbi:hypothetical protein PACTADRAFT_50102 [Pachysolen tannophilus NRRL Y-2460]|uniref:ER membrane protein complex subunit 10 n=1 Tax=Pachysolen tannophilus NRRL Y-2460 TaxID=669874 RepID=A0A1E4TUN2_PACTA|nr:hypothetical protein PACTADRAFT_50102 [Pachysolen tannophilus NRRL Y-2460]